MGLININEEYFLDCSYFKKHMEVEVEVNRWSKHYPIKVQITRKDK